MIISRVIAISVIVVTIVAFLAQFVIQPSPQNIACDCIILASSLAAIFYVVFTGALEARPLSAYSILGFCVTTQLGALLAQTATWTPLTNSLYNPIYTFGTLAAYQFVAISVHALMRYFSTSSSARESTLRRIVAKLSVYETPQPATLWLMGGFGVASFAFSTGESIQNKIGHALQFLTWAPFLIPIYAFHGDGTYCKKSRSLPFLGAYALLVALIGVATNFRSIIFVGIVTVALLYLLEGLRTKRSTTWPELFKFGVVLALAALVAGPISDLATSMAIARVSRGKASAMAMIENTFYLWNQKYLIDAYRAQEKLARFSSYDELYIANPMVARFVETKFHDNALHFARSLVSPDSKARLAKVTVDSFWTVLPSPMLSGLDININKVNMRFSMGDYLAYLSRGVPLGGYRTGSIFAQGYALLGAFFPFVYAAICFILFGIMDLLTVRAAVGPSAVSALGMMQIWPFFWYGITAEGFYNIFAFVVRDFEQMMLIYFLVLSLARMLLPEKLSVEAALATPARLTVPTVPAT